MYSAPTASSLIPSVPVGRAPESSRPRARSTSAGGDTLVVRDDGAMRYTVFGPDGALVETQRRDIVGTYASVDPAPLADGAYVDWSVVFPDGRFGARLQLVPIRYEPRFEQADTFPSLDYTWQMLPSGIAQTYYTGGLIGRVDAEGSVWFARSEEYQIYRRTVAGDTTLIFSLPERPPPLGDAERAALRDDLAHLPQLLAEVLDALPQTLPVLLQVVPNNAGHVFVFPDVVSEPAGSVVDVFEDTGVYLGRMELPATAYLHPRSGPIVHASADHLLLVTTDELDVPYITRFKIVKAR